MSYPRNLRKAAHRHWAAAESLRTTTKSVAGYLYGLAAECAVKAIMEDEGLHLQPREGRDPFYDHYPALRDSLHDQIQGRGASRLMRFCEDRYLDAWHIKMRYSDGSSITSERVEHWRKNAEAACAEL